MHYSVELMTQRVGQFIKERREKLGISQKALGQSLTPCVTTQFISNVERGITPLPPIHVDNMAKALQISSGQLCTLIEQEFTKKLCERSGVSWNKDASEFKVLDEHAPVFRKIYERFCRQTPEAQEAFLNVCETMLEFRRNE